MTRSKLRTTSLMVACLTGLSLLVACGGGGGSGGGGGDGILSATSFAGFMIQPGNPGPNTGVPLPTVFLDQALEFTFDGPIDRTALGGLATDGMGGNLEYIGVPPVAGASGIPYHPFADQAAAQASIEIRENGSGALLPAYIVGLHRDRPNTLVLDPSVPLNRANELGIGAGVGFATSTTYTFRIPPGNGITFGGSPARPLGVPPLQLPIVAGTFTVQPGVSLLFQSGTSTGPNPNPPRLLSVATGTGRTGTNADPIASDDPFVFTWDQAIDPNSIDLLSNLTIRNLDLGNRIVPGSFVINPAQPNIAVFTPNPSWGPGNAGMMVGYRIQVQVTSSATNPILGVPQGILGTQNEMDPLTNFNGEFRTEFCPTCEGSVAVIEGFENQTQRDGTFTSTFNAAGWNNGNNGRLDGVAISGSALASFNGTNDLGTRTQVTVLAANQLSTPPPVGLFSPFDSVNNNNGTNPNGGSHTMQLIQSSELGNPRASLELIEWGPSNPTNVQMVGAVNATTYPMYQAWCGASSITGALTCPMGVNGLSPLYIANYDTTNSQPVDPANTNAAAANPNSGGVNLSGGPTPYTTNAALTTYYPFPLFTPTFDFQGQANGGAATLLWEVNIESGMQVSNFNRWRATAFTPVRRGLGDPLSSGNQNWGVGGCDTYDNRFTFVDMVASAQSNFYDSGVMVNNMPGGTTVQYRGVQIIPDPVNQPTGTESRWEFMGAQTILSPNTPGGAPNTRTGWLTYFDGTPIDPATGMARMANPEILFNAEQPMAEQVSNHRYFRWRVTMRNNNVTNGRPSYESIIMAAVTVAVP